jgi:hypothetical protein
MKQVGRELGVNYVVEGSVRREAGRVRVTAQLINATSDDLRLAPSQAKLMGDPSPALRNRWLPLLLEQVVKRLVQQVLLRGVERVGKCLVWFAGPAPVVAHIWEGAGSTPGLYVPQARPLEAKGSHD